MSEFLNIPEILVIHEREIERETKREGESEKEREREISY